MERRREPRIACYQRAWLTVLGENHRSIACHAIELSGRGMRIVLDQDVPPGTPIAIETRDWMAFGEVCYSRHEYTHYAVGLRLDQALALREAVALRRTHFEHHTSSIATRHFSLTLDVVK